MGDGGAMLTGRMGMELKVLPVWQRGPLEADRNLQHILVEARVGIRPPQVGRGESVAFRARECQP